MAEQKQLPRNLDARDFAQWLASALEREGWSRNTHQQVEDWLYEQTGRTVLPRAAP